MMTLMAQPQVQLLDNMLLSLLEGPAIALLHRSVSQGAEVDSCFFMNILHLELEDYDILYENVFIQY